VRLIAFYSRGRSRALVASLLSGVVLLLNAMAVSPSLHEWFHADAANGQHQCAVTVFAHGQVDSVIAEVPAVAPLILVQITPVVKFTVFSPAIENLPIGRAPPTAFANS
jgi:hypothetical protein